MCHVVFRLEQRGLSDDGEKVRFPSIRFTYSSRGWSVNTFPFSVLAAAVFPANPVKRQLFHYSILSSLSHTQNIYILGWGAIEN
jgi:hypothetical protein